MQPTSDPVTGLHHHASDTGMRQRVRDSQSRDPRADHYHPLDRTTHLARHISSTIVIRPGRYHSHSHPAARPSRQAPS
jgi:hypothetical protein